MSVSISHVVISGFTQSDTLMNLHDRIKAAIDLSGKVEIVDPNDTKVDGDGESHFITSHNIGFVLQSYGCEDIVSKNLMFLLGHVAQRIFSTTRAIYMDDAFSICKRHNEMLHNENHIC